MILPMDSQLRRFFNSRTQRNASKVWKKWRRLWSGEIPMDRARGAWNTEIVVLSDETHFGNHPGQENQCGITLCVVIVFARCLNIQYSIVGPIITVHTWDSRSSLSLVISIFFGKFPASNWMLRQKNVSLLWDFRFQLHLCYPALNNFANICSPIAGLIY